MQNKIVLIASILILSVAFLIFKGLTREGIKAIKAYNQSMNALY